MIAVCAGDSQQGVIGTMRSGHFRSERMRITGGGVHLSMTGSSASQRPE
jgi:hypothetical protein